MMHSTTENNAIAHSTTCSAILDLFINTVRNTKNEYIDEKMKDGWNEDPLLLMKLICYTRDPRNGKGERDIFYMMMNYLKDQMPKTYYLNIKKMAIDYGRIDDLLMMEEYEIFAEILKDDLKKEKPSLAYKWAPREANNRHDAMQIAEILFPFEKNKMMLYRKKILNVLNKKITTVENLMCANQWDKIKYEQVPSQAMKIYGRTRVREWVKNDKDAGGIFVEEIEDRRYKEKKSEENFEENFDDESINNEDTELRKYKDGAFMRHDKERYTQYIIDVQMGKKKVNTTGIHPHQLVKEIMQNENEIIEAQWNAIIEKLKDIEMLKSSVAVVDVSGSMGGQPLNVAISLGLIISSLASEPYNNKVITFSSNPNFVDIIGDSLYDKVKNINEIDWHQNTNIEKVFDLILNTAIMFNVEKEKMIKYLFIFTDMQFDEAANNPHKETLFQQIKKKYNDKNYDLPKLIFWNLRCSDTNNNAFPVTIDENNTCYLSGFSIELLKVFMNGAEMTPLNILMALVNKYEVQIDKNEITEKISDGWS